MHTRHWILLVLLALSTLLAGCGERGVEIQPRGQMVIGGSVGSTTK